MSVSRDAVTSASEELLGQSVLDQARLMDVVANGVQFLGAETVTKIAVGVSLNQAFLEEAVKWGAEYCIFHHGFDPRTHLSRYTLSAQKRMRLIFEQKMTIAGYHAALDMHPEIGNNALILEKLGAKRGASLYEGWGYVGHLEDPKSVDQLKAQCEELFNHEVMAFSGGNTEVQTIGVCSGAAKPYDLHIWEMQQRGVQLFISGETSESIPHKLMESDIDYFVCGHYATEVFGVKALGEKLSKKFGDEVEIRFIDVVNVI